MGRVGWERGWRGEGRVGWEMGSKRGRVWWEREDRVREG